jgi:hypothetical protein
MAVVTKGKTFASGEVVTPNKVHELVDNATVTGIVNADVSGTAAIAGTKIAPNFGTQDITVSGGNRSITNTDSFALVFATSNTEQVRIDASGNVGIGTASPGEKLHVAGVCRLGPQGGGEGGELQLLNVAGNAVGVQIDVGPNDEFRLNNAQNTFTSFHTNSTERMRITASGNVGIGTTSPARKFHTVVVAAPAAAQSSKVGLLIQNGDGTGTSGSPNSAIIQFAYDPASPRAYIEAGTLGNDFLAFGYGTTERMRIDGSGNVGIGKTNPATILDVNGTITATAFSGPLTGNVTGNVTGNLTGTASAVAAGMSISYPTLTGVREAIVNLGAVSGSQTFNLQSGNIFQVKPNGAITVAPSNIPSSGTFVGILIRHEGDGTARTYTWPGTTKWAFGETPSMTSTNGKFDIVSLFTYDGGTTWFGQILGQNY